MVCAGTQKNGMVFLNTKFHWADQFRFVIICVIGIGVANARSEPPQASICVSVILWKVINIGAKMPFIPTEMQKATNTFSKLSGAFIMVEAWLIPIYSSATGTPLEKIIIARLIPMPNIPQTTARGAIPKLGFRYTPELRRSPSSSPRVESIANLRK